MVAAANKEKDEKRMFVGMAWNCAAELKLFLTALLFLCTLATVLQFLPSRFLLSPSDLRRCLSTPTDLSNSSSAPAALQDINRDNISSDGVVRRAFNPYGSAAYNFILMSAYRGGPHSFAVVGLSSKPLHVYGKPSYECEWVSGNTSISTAGYKILPDWGYGRVYTVVVVNCTFPRPAVAGGQLLVHAATNGGGGINSSDTIVVLEERPEDYKAEWESAPAYEYLYCGSPLYGNLSPQRVREWMAYHVRLLGAKSHFVIHDAGGVHDGLRAVLSPWMEKGFVTLQDVRDQEKLDGYYHNQFLVLNDCLHRYRFSAKWIFFFDVDEFVFVPKGTINAVMDSLSKYTQLTMVQMPMSSTLCLSEDAPQRSRKWGFEKLVYKDVKRGRRDRKYAVQPRNVFATGVHMSQSLVGKTTHDTYGRISYFHYHGTIAQRREPCKQFLNDSQITLDGVPYVMDTTMRQVAGAVKRFELKTIGPVLQTTTQ
ncbi:galactan beta-1,4-galactosyltransferase GALS3-like [Salvia miltiorrhiza]|uniref:galactan beta-1,4-galactosyltransferase GALS3-like n=1 Tax=Salvia miltiorrhiza TaxID=226208 RepID=UPI0025ACF624|nr:galactan beta-1,4-galactosyltransferase GALS3-like [Salvia miltiorrhiza]